IWPHICVQAAQQDQPQLFQDLGSTVAKMRSLTPNQSIALAQQVDTFHRTIALSLNNETLLSAFSVVLARISRYPCTNNSTTLYYGTVYYHDLLLSAMLRRDPEQIRSVVRDYFAHVKLDFYQPPSSDASGSALEAPAQ
ncbi:MAG: FCD domain-containing protein, partial [Candidatus Onthomonas sp.]